MVKGLKFRIKDERFRIWDLGLRARIQGLGLMVFDV
jgi:hypothetical protein